MKKTCSVCGEVKAETNFDYHKGHRNHVPYCKECRKKQRKAHYEQNKKTYMEYAKKRNKTVIQENRVKFIDYLLLHPCVDCGETNPAVLEFDHLRDKWKEVARLKTTAYCWETIQSEIDKCEVRCVKCHRLKTLKQSGWWGWQLLEERGYNQ